MGLQPIGLGSLQEEKRHTGADDLVTEAELGVMCPQAKERPGLLATSRSQERRGSEREPGLETP